MSEHTEEETEKSEEQEDSSETKEETSNSQNEDSSKPEPKEEPIKHESHKPKKEPKEKIPFKERSGKWYDKNYKLLLLIPLILLVLSLVQLGIQYQQTGDFINKDITLTGGTSITIFTQDSEISTVQLSEYLSLSGKVQDFSVRELSDFRSGKQKAVIIESVLESNELKPLIEEFINYNLDSENSSIESTGSSLGESFYNQLRFAILISFILMAVIVFLIFRNIVPSTAVVISAFADIIMTLAFIDILGIKLSTAGITAILMLIGYSVDSDIMLTTRLLKRHGEINKNLKGAFKTGITMTLTSIVALIAALLITQSFSSVLEQIFTILLIGLAFDILNTWITNASILKWYLEKHRRE
ncbi:MAG: protein translocase subunit SecF [archaeon]